MKRFAGRLNFDGVSAWVIPVVSAMLAITALIVAAGPPSNPASRYLKTQVEIAPKVFIDLERWDWVADDPKNKIVDEFTRIKLRVGDREAVWEGEEIPIILRQHEKMLYLACYRRPGNAEAVERTRYFRLEGNRFVPILWSAFPPSIATQNMWVSDFRLESILKLDTASDHFQSSAGAAVWYELLNEGKPHPAGSSFVDKAVLDEFKRKCQPTPLSSIVPPTTQPRSPNK